MRSGGVCILENKLKKQAENRYEAERTDKSAEKKCFKKRTPRKGGGNFAGAAE